MAKIEIPLKKDYAGAFKYWVDTNTENGVCTIPEYICKGIVEMLGKQPDVPDTNVGDLISRRTAIDAAALSAAEWDGMYVQDINGRIRKALEKLPPAQPEITEEAVKEYCRKRCLCVVDGALLKKYASAQPEQRWIPCSEQLPRQGQEVICQCRANIIKVLKLDAYGDWYQDAEHCYMGGFVIAWMPLPETYKEGKTT